jgi:hypothetical protein
VLKQMRIAVSPAGWIIVVDQDTYTITVWTEHGALLATHQAEPLWEPRPPTPITAVSASSRLYGFVSDIHVDSGGLLWVVSWIPAPNWRSKLPTNSEADVYVNVMEVIDLSTGQKVARTELGGRLIYAFLGDGLVQGPVYSDDMYQIAVSTVHLGQGLAPR